MSDNVPDGNLFVAIPADLPDELAQTLYQNPQLRIERIVSRGHASAADFWYDQDCDEWVVLLQGAARLRFADSDGTLALSAGDYVLIAAHRKHQVVWTDPQQDSLWLAVYCTKRG